MKTTDLLILAGVGLGAALLLSKDKSNAPPNDNSIFDTIPAGTDTGKVTVTEDITSPRAGVDYINKNILNKQTGQTSYQTAGGGTVTVDYTANRTTVTSKKGGSLVVNTTKYTPPPLARAPTHAPVKNAAVIKKIFGR